MYHRYVKIPTASARNQVSVSKQSGQCYSQIWNNQSLHKNMHNKIHSVISLLFWIKNADTEIGWNVRILRSVWIISAEIRYLLSEQKKFQNKSKNIDEVYQSVFFRCIMLLLYRVTFLCNVFSKFIIHQKALCDIFL